jgi:hypothetical protein
MDFGPASPFPVWRRLYALTAMDNFDPQRAAASVVERLVVDRACGENEDRVSLGEEVDDVTRQ